jgi:hypothetical protein
MTTTLKGMNKSISGTDFPETIDRNGYINHKIPLMTTRAKTLLAKKKNKTKTEGTTTTYSAKTTAIALSQPTSSQGMIQPTHYSLQRQSDDGHVIEDKKSIVVVDDFASTPKKKRKNAEELCNNNKKENDTTDSVATRRSHQMMKDYQQAKRGMWGRSWRSTQDLKVEDDNDDDEEENGESPTPRTTGGAGRGHPALSRAMRSFRHLLVVTNVVDQEMTTSPPQRGLQRARSNIFHRG